MSSDSLQGRRAGAILLVEDNPHDEALALRALALIDLAECVTVVRDGEEALDYLFATGVHADRSPGDLPAVVLLDLNLPKIGGLEVLERLRASARTKLLPVVVLSSSDEPRDLAESYRRGANSYVRKPIRFDAFSAAVCQVGLYWLQRNEPPPRGEQP